jgi:hypothetical protein
MRWLCVSFAGLVLLGGALGCHHTAPNADCDCGGGGPPPGTVAPVPIKPVPAPALPSGQILQPVPSGVKGPG